MFSAEIPQVPFVFLKCFCLFLGNFHTTYFDHIHPPSSGTSRFLGLGGRNYTRDKWMLVETEFIK